MVGRKPAATKFPKPINLSFESRGAPLYSLSSNAAFIKLLHFAVNSRDYLDEKVGHSNVVIEGNLIINSISLSVEVIYIDNRQKLLKVKFVILAPHNDGRLNSQSSSNNRVIGFDKLKSGLETGTGIFKYLDNFFNLSKRIVVDLKCLSD